MLLAKSNCCAFHPLENVWVLPHTVLPLCYSRVAHTPMMLPASTTATEVCQARAPHPAQNSTIKWKLSEVWCTSHVYMADSNNRSVAQTELTLPSSSSAGLSSALAGQVPATLELKVEKPDKDDMRDDLSENKSDDESDKNMRTPRAGTRTRYCVIVALISHVQPWEWQNNIYLHAMSYPVKWFCPSQYHWRWGSQSRAEGRAWAWEKDG